MTSKDRNVFLGQTFYEKSLILDKKWYYCYLGLEKCFQVKPWVEKCDLFFLKITSFALKLQKFDF